MQSYSVSSAGKLKKASSLSLGGYVQDIQATPDRLIVSRYNYDKHNGASEISLIDISSPEGTMIEGDAIVAKGRVTNKFNMDIDGDILRVVSGNSWASSTNTNHVETFDAADIQNITPIDSKTFGDNEDLYATLFMDNSAFFVTYRRVDPFHAFEITDTGMITEKSEFIVTGWNDYFKPVVAKSRLIGIGKNDENGRSTMAVSLYDVTDLTNPTPLITRAEIELDRSWSEAQWDDRAFSVLEKATSVLSGDGTATETGVVLLPFSGWNDAEKRYVSAVQIFTFSRDTLTLRGVMDHGSHVRRSFVAEPTANTTANLSEAELSLFDTTDPDAPVEKGRVELAPHYAHFDVYGNYGVRHHDRSSYYGWWGSHGAHTHKTTRSRSYHYRQDVDLADPVATIDVPANTQTYKIGDLLVAVSSAIKEDPSGDYQKRKQLTTIETWDLSDPTNPVRKGELTTDKLEFQGRYGYWGEDCWDCGGDYYGGGPVLQATPLDGALAFVSTVHHEEFEGSITAHLGLSSLR